MCTRRGGECGESALRVVGRTPPFITRCKLQQVTDQVRVKAGVVEQVAVDAEGVWVWAGGGGGGEARGETKLVG